MYCEVCGCEAPTRYVSFHQNIGLLVMRLYNGTEGNLCKPCIHKTFWKYTAINMTLGWWGVISLIVTPFFQLNNMVRYLMCMGMESPAPGAAPPELNDIFFQRIGPHTDYLVQRLNQGENLQAVSSDVAMRAGVTPGQVALFTRAMIAQAQQQQQ
jgi:hypothetical protein